MNTFVLLMGKLVWEGGYRRAPTAQVFSGLCNKKNTLCENEEGGKERKRESVCLCVCVWCMCVCKMLACNLV